MRPIEAGDPGAPAGWMDEKRPPESTRAPEEEIQLLMRARSDVYFLTPHYEGWDAVLVRLDAVDEEELAGRIEDAYAFIAAKRPRKRNT